jgi:glycosyltransferase domain-containing protein
MSRYGGAVRHVIFPGNMPGGSKLSQGLALVQTAYASFCADDDLVFPEGLAQSIAFLERHPDYVCAHGLYLNFRQVGRHVNIGSEYSGPSNEAAHPGARIFRLCQKYESLFYAAFRTQDLRDIFLLLPTLDTSVFMELFQSVATVVKGKVKRLPSLYAARQYGPPAEPEREKWNTFYWFAENPGETLEHYRAYCETLWTFYQANAPAPQLDKQAFFKILDLAHAVYFSSGCSPRHFHSVLQSLWPEDPYQMIGPLDALRVADKLIVAKRAMFPGGDTGADVLEQLSTPVGFPRWVAAGTLAALRYLWLITWSFATVAQLNREVKKACGTEWRCHLLMRSRWLVAVPGFRNTCLELCHYLDRS